MRFPPKLCQPETSVPLAVTGLGPAELLHTCSLEMRGGQEPVRGSGGMGGGWMAKLQQCNVSGKLPEEISLPEKFTGSAAEQGCLKI